MLSPDTKPLSIEPHLADDILDRYAMGTLQTDLIASVEEHLLFCGHCQSKLTEADEFVTVFRAAVTKVLATPRLERQLWTRAFGFRPGRWAGAMAIAVLAIGCFVVESEISKHSTHIAPAVVLMQALRGSESGVVAPAGKPALLSFELPASVNPADCRVEIVDLEGKKVVQTGTALDKGRLISLVGKLGAGSYWVRLYRRGDNELLGEYSLRAEKN